MQSKVRCFLVAVTAAAGLVAAAGIAGAPLASAQNTGNCGHGPGSECSDPSTAHITVTPFRALKNNQVVKVTGSGFTPSTTVGLEMCAAVVKSNNDCDLNTAQTPGKTNTSGGFSFSFTVSSSITTPNQGKIACGLQGNCSVGASSNFNTGIPGANEDVGFGTGVYCTVSATAKFTPGLKTTAHSVSYTISGSLNPCYSNDASITKGTLSAKGSGSLSCTSGTSSGTGKATYNTGKDSLLSFKTSQTSSSGTTTIHASGKVTSGTEFSGAPLTALLTFKPSATSCASTGVTSATLTGTLDIA